MTTRLGRVAGCLALAFATARCADKILAPVANAGTAVTVNMGSSVALDGRSSADPQGRSLAYDWSITARPVLSQTSLNDAHIATPSFIPDLDGSYTIDLVVSNGVLSSPASQVIVTARKCSEAAPDVTAAVAAPANPNTGNTVQLSATVHDADNDPACNLNQTFTLLWTAVARPSASIAVLSDPAAVSPTFVPDQTGPYQFSVVATDSTGLRSAPKFLTVTTTDCGNHAPAATIASAPASPVPGSSIQLTPTVTDADNAGTCLLNQGFTYAWALTRPPSSATALLSDPAATSPSFTPDVAGTYRATLTVTDSAGLSSKVAVRDVVVGPCGAGAVTFAAPAITAVFAESAANVGAAVTLTAHPVDPAVACGTPAGSVQYVWTLAGPSGSSAVAFAVQAGTQFTFTPDVVGTYDVSVRAVDTRGQSANASTSVSTSTCGAAPIAVQLTPAASTVNSYQPLTLTATPAATGCPARFAPQIAWAVAGVGAPAQLSGSFGGTVDFRSTGPGDYRVSAVAINTSGHEGQVGTASVHVDACGSRPPVVVTTGNSPTFPARRQTVTLSATAVDPDGACGDARTSTIGFELLSLPQGSAVSFAAGATSFQADVEGKYAFRVVATEDGTGLRSDAAILNVTVLDPDPAASSVTAVATGGSGFVVANDVETATVTVTVRNRLGQPIGSLPVSLAVSGSANTFNPLSGSGSTSQAGVFQATLRSTKAETKTIAATANPGAAQVVLNDHPSVSVVAGPTASIVLTGLPATVTAGVASTVTVTAFDAFANVAKGPNAYTGTVHFTSTDPFPASLPANFTFPPTDDGTHTFINGVTLFTAGSQTVTVTDTVNGTLTSSQPATVNAAAPASAAFSVQPSSATAGVHIAPAVEVTVTDAFTNLVPGASVTLSIGVNAGGGTLSGTTTRPTNATGVASFADLSIDKTGTGYKLHATVPSIPSPVTADSTAFDITAAAPATAVFSVQPAITTTGLHITPAVRITVKDAFLNLVPGASVTISIGTNPTGGTLSGTTSGTTNASGVANFADLSINKAGTGYKLHAAVTGTPGDGSTAFDIVDPAVITTFIAAPRSIFSGGATQLSYLFSGGTGSIDPGGHPATSPGATVVMNVATTTTFTLNVTNAAGTVTSASATATVTTPTAWVDLNNPTPTSPDTRAAQPFSMTFDPADPSTIYAATLKDGVLKTATGGPPWSGTGFPAATPALGVSVAHPGAALSIWASVNCTGKLFHSTNGSTWTEVTGPTNGLPAAACPIGRSAIVLDPSDPQQQTLYVAFSQDGLFRSTDDGATWSKIPLPLTSPNFDDQATALAIASNGTVFVGTAPGNLFHVSGSTATLLITTDASQVNAIATDPEGTTVVAGHGDGAVEFATGPGFAFTARPPLTGSVAGLAFTVDGVSSGGVITGSTYAVTATGTASGGAVFRSTGFGAPFKNVTAATPAIEASDYFFVAPHPRDGTTMYVLGNGSLSTPPPAAITIPSSGFFRRTFGNPP